MSIAIIPPNATCGFTDFKEVRKRACQARSERNILGPGGIIPNQSMSDLLDTAELRTALKKCPEWEHEKNAITRTIEFEEFNDAIDFVNDLAEIAEEAQHHPDIIIRHTKVTLKLTTHDAGGVTNLDIELAQRVDNLVD
jgi:4a-hydroxytetrahydrobiopterin dehydratase